MALEQRIQESKEERKQNSSYISTMLDVGEEVECEKIGKDEIVMGQYGKQLAIEIFVNGEKKSISRPFPLSEKSLNFVSKLVIAAKHPPFFIKKCEDESGKVYYDVRNQGKPAVPDTSIHDFAPVDDPSPLKSSLPAEDEIKIEDIPF